MAKRTFSVDSTQRRVTVLNPSCSIAQVAFAIALTTAADRIVATVHLYNLQRSLPVTMRARAVSIANAASAPVTKAHPIAVIAHAVAVTQRAVNLSGHSCHGFFTVSHRYLPLTAYAKKSRHRQKYHYRPFLHHFFASFPPALLRGVARICLNGHSICTVSACLCKRFPAGVRAASVELF